MLRINFTSLKMMLEKKVGRFMKYSKEEVIQYVQEEDVKFIRLAFCDVFGKQKNISIMPEELPRAFEYGIAIDASALDGFGDENHYDLFLHLFSYPFPTQQKTLLFSLTFFLRIPLLNEPFLNRR